LTNTTILPLSIIKNLSQYFSADDKRCVLINTVLFSYFSSTNKSIIDCIPKRSNPKNGSSMIYNSGSTMNAQIIITFCFIPLEKGLGNISYSLSNLNVFNNGFALFIASSLSILYAIAVMLICSCNVNSSYMTGASGIYDNL